MPEKNADRKLEPNGYETFLLVGFFFFLPFLEAPKNLFLYAYFCYWMFRRAKSKFFGPKDYLFEIPLFGIFALGVVTALYVAIQENLPLTVVLLKTTDFLGMTLLAIAIRRTKWYTNQGFNCIFFALGAGIIIALCEGLIRGATFPSLRSVGHINQVAIFLTLMTAVAFASALYREQRTERMLFLSAAILLFILTIETASRNAFYALCVVLPVLFSAAFFQERKTFRAYLAGFAVLIASITAVLGFNDGLMQKQLTHLSRGSLDVERYKLLNTSVFFFLNRPVLGHGPDRFQDVVTEENMQKLSAKKNFLYSADQFYFSAHAHNLVMQCLVERGIIATIIFVYWLVYLFVTYTRFLFSCSSRGAGVRSEKEIIFIGFAALLVGLLCGVGNTTFRQEHGLLAIALISLGYSGLRQSAAKVQLFRESTNKST